jgi:acylphosphatase
MRRVHVIARGNVQGVGYRYTARLFAERFSVSGWVRNLSDGSVEAELEASAGHLDEMLDWMAHGPPGSSVQGLEISDIAPTGQRSFEVRETA